MHKTIDVFQRSRRKVKECVVDLTNKQVHSEACNHDTQTRNCNTSHKHNLLTHKYAIGMQSVRHTCYDCLFVAKHAVSINSISIRMTSAITFGV